MSGGNATEIRAELARAWQAQRIHGAYLFEGPAGTGKRATAAWLAHLLLCGRDPAGDDPEATIDFPSHADLRVVEPDGSYIKVDQIRGLQRDLSLVANERGHRMAVLLDAHRLRLEASNALLKTLEEPPRLTTLVLVAERSLGLPPTVLSRTTRMRFAPEPEEQVRRTLAADGWSAGDARLAAALGGGSRVAAQRWSEAHLAEAGEIRELLVGAPERSAGELIEYAGGYRGAGEAVRTRTELFLDVFAAVVREHVEGAARNGDSEAASRWLDRSEAAERVGREWRRRNLNSQMVIEGLLLGLSAP
jgi:DNA polymerase-3 subunit delta'